MNKLVICKLYSEPQMVHLHAAFDPQRVSGFPLPSRHLQYWPNGIAPDREMLIAKPSGPYGLLVQCCKSEMTECDTDDA
jgi:hypothetical protein